MTLRISSFGMQANKSSQLARQAAILDFYGFPEDFPIEVVPDAATCWSGHLPFVDVRDLDGLIGQVDLQFISNVVPYATCRVTVDASVSRAWTEDFQSGNQWELITYKQLGGTS